MPNIDFDRQTTISFPGSGIPSITPGTSGTSGIANGSLALREILCADRIAFGDINANQFQCVLYGSKDLTGKKIQVSQTDGGTTKILFTGWVDSCKVDDISGYRTVIAYDYMFKAGKKKIKGWWNSFWNGKNQSTIGAMWRSLLSYYNVSYTNKNLMCDGVVFKKTKKTKKLKTSTLANFLNQLGEINLAIPKMSRSGVLEFITFDQISVGTAVDIRGEYSISQSKFEDYVVSPYNKVELYNENNVLKGEAGSGSNVLAIQNNIFLYGQKDVYMQEIAHLMNDNMFQFSYRPATITMKVSNLDLPLGTLVRAADRVDNDGNTQEVYSLICENNYTGPILVDQAIVSNDAEEMSPDKGSEATGTTLGVNDELRDLERLEYKIDDNAQDLTLEKMDDGTIVIRDKEQAEAGNPVVKQYLMWATGLHTNPNWAIAIETITSEYDFVCVAVKDGQGRISDRPLYGRGRMGYQLHLVMAVPTPIAYGQLDNSMTGSAEQVSGGLDAYNSLWGTSGTFVGRRILNGTGIKYVKDGIEYEYVTHQFGFSSAVYGLIEERTKWDYYFNSAADYTTALNSGEIKVHADGANGDITLPTGKQQTQEAKAMEDLAAKISGTSGSSGSSAPDVTNATHSSSDAGSKENYQRIVEATKAIAESLDGAVHFMEATSTRGNVIGYYVNYPDDKTVETNRKKLYANTNKIFTDDKALEEFIGEHSADLELGDTYMQICDESGQYVKYNMAETGSTYKKTSFEYNYTGSYIWDGQHEEDDTNTGKTLRFNLGGVEVGKPLSLRVSFTLTESATAQLSAFDLEYDALGAFGMGVGLGYTQTTDKTGAWHAEDRYQEFVAETGTTTTTQTYTVTVTPTQEMLSMGELPIVIDLTGVLIFHDYFGQPVNPAKALSITFDVGGTTSHTILVKHVYTYQKSAKDGETTDYYHWYEITGNGGGGTSDLDAIELDKATYDALPSSEKSDPDKIYFVTDYPSGGGGGGTGGVLYGYNNPTDIVSDGTLYILLDDNNKQQGVFLFMSTEWVLIDGMPYTTEYTLYDNGTEEVAWSVSGGTKNSDNISLNVGGGTYSNYAVTTNPIDLTNYYTVKIQCRYRDQDYSREFDISGYTGLNYLSFTYLTDSSHNEVAVGVSPTYGSATTFRIDSRNGGTAEAKMYYMSLTRGE